MDILRDIEFLREIARFRDLTRAWCQFIDTPVENNTEHSFRVVWTALILAEHESRHTGKTLDTGRIMKMALAHDLAELRTGDAHYLSRYYMERDEERAITDIFAGTILGEEYAEIALAADSRNKP